MPAKIIAFPHPYCQAVATPPPAPTPAPIIQRKRGETEGKDQRNAMLAKVHVALGQIRRDQLAKGERPLDDDTYRYILRENWGVDSASKLSNAQLHELLLHFQGLGWQKKRGASRKAGNKKSDRADVPTELKREPLIAKIEALLAEKGRVEGTHMPWGYAVGILKRQTRNTVISLDKATPMQLRDVMLAIQNDAHRKGRYLGD